jgi:hypothetical protein
LQELKSNDSLVLRGLCVGSSPIGGANPLLGTKISRNAL